MTTAIHVPLHCIRHTKIGGTEFAIYNLLRGMAAIDAPVTVTHGRDADLSPAFLAWMRGEPRITSRRAGGLPGPKGIRFAEECLFEWRRRDADWALYPNYFCPPPRPFARGLRATILHDIQYRVLPQYHSAERRAWLDFYLPRLFASADAVVLISRSELSLVEEHFGAAAAARCDVVPNAIDWDRFARPSGDEPAPEVARRIAHPYVLTVCHQFPHKNLATLLRAFVRVAARDPDIRLYMVGTASPANRAFVRANCPEEMLDRIEMLGFVDDADIGTYYRHARLFALPSLYEGFGMPAVEALGHGIPTLVGNLRALPEVTLGRAHYVEDPLDVGEWAERLEALLRSDERPTADTVALIRETYRPATVAAALIDVLEARSH